MAMALQMSTLLQQYLYSSAHKVSNKSDKPLRMGVLSTAMINPAALLDPSLTHPEVILYGIASRDAAAAQRYAQKYHFQRSYGSYQALLDDAAVDAVYISLPNGMHAEWARQALQAGKHVLLEKPFTANVDEARELVELAVRKDVVLEEAFHWQFHPAAHVVESLIKSERYGKVVGTHARMTTPRGSIPKNDIRWQYELGGGALMDMTYVVSATRYFLAASTPREIVSARPRPYAKDPRVDEAMTAEIVFETSRGVDGAVRATIYADMDRANVATVVPRVWELPSIKIELEKATIYFYNFMMPHLYHYIAVTDKVTKATSYQKHYSFGPKWGARSEPFWSTYRYQLEAFVDKVKGRTPGHWIELDDSIAQMETLDMIYEHSGLGKRMGTRKLVADA